MTRSARRKAVRHNRLLRLKDGMVPEGVEVVRQRAEDKSLHKEPIWYPPSKREAHAAAKIRRMYGESNPRVRKDMVNVPEGSPCCRGIPPCGAPTNVGLGVVVPTKIGMPQRVTVHPLCREHFPKEVGT